MADRMQYFADVIEREENPNTPSNSLVVSSPVSKIITRQDEKIIMFFVII
jgi:hypothetical protein